MTVLYLSLAVGAGAMLLAMLLANRNYHHRVWKLAVIAVLGAVCGVYATKLMYLIENGQWSGLSWYGGVFFTPFAIMLIALIIKMPVSDALDLFAPAECAMLVLQKVRCRIEGRCGGIRLYDSRTLTIHFPSQIVEMATAAVLAVILIRFLGDPRKRGALYGWYMFLYGICRFILQWFREGATAVVWIFSMGHIWSVVSICIGAAVIYRRSRKDMASNVQE
ncbi:MAG: prolipoprotein diacylglyceryl transferase [Clostridiales bacterium]|nr:prolipoprotein diacylglyceryl transferase [Clostridiales bacterium]